MKSPVLPTALLGASRSRYRFMPRFVLAGVLALGVLPGCKAVSKRLKYSPRNVTKVLAVPTETLQPAIAANIGAEDRPKWVTPDRWKRVRGLYAAFDNAPLWLEEGGIKDRANALLDAIRMAPDHALDTTAYPVSEITALVNAKRLTDTASAKTLADADVMLTSAYVAYAADMLVGQVDPASVSQAWHIPARPKELDSAIVRGIEGTDMKQALAEMAPHGTGYMDLKDAYARYRKIAASGGWPAISSTSDPALVAAVAARVDPELVRGDSSAVGARAVDSVATPVPVPAPAGKKGGKRATAASAAAGAGLSKLLAQFQEHHGLDRTGRLDKATLAELNVPAEERVKQIAANLERHRWLPRSLGSRYVYVNVPAFRLDAYDSGQKTLSMKVVVGQEYEGKKTPVFSDSMETVAFRPYWNITPDIQAKEVGPKAAADPGYLDRENMEYYTDGGARRIRQKPGGKNALGLVKFLFPNSFNIYLHDTPTKALFQQTARAVSHGCIRLEKPAELAQWVLGWDAERVQAAMNGTEDNKQVRVVPKIPVYIVYFTSYIRDGQLFFGDDIYKRDDKLEEQVAAKAAATH
jgi:murein L,D-transpeptidase YcbB/YkuD